MRYICRQIPATSRKILAFGFSLKHQHELPAPWVSSYFSKMRRQSPYFFCYLVVSFFPVVLRRPALEALPEARPSSPKPCLRCLLELVTYSFVLVACFLLESLSFSPSSLLLKPCVASFVLVTCWTVLHRLEASSSVAVFLEASSFYASTAFVPCFLPFSWGFVLLSPQLRFLVISVAWPCSWAFVLVSWGSVCLGLGFRPSLRRCLFELLQNGPFITCLSLKVLSHAYNICFILYLITCIAGVV